MLLVHETAADRTVWDAVGDALSAGTRAIAYDRRGWGETSAPDDYRRTTVEEQSEDAAALIEAAGAAPAVVVGAGIGAMVALDLLLRRPDLLAATVLIEPPVLQLVPMATEALSQDRQRLEIAAGGGESVIDLYLSGGLPALGAGVRRLPEPLVAAARERPGSLIAELGIATGWRAPLTSLAAAEHPSAIVTATSTPALLRDAAGALDTHLAGATAVELDSGEALPQLGAAGDVAALARSVSR